MAEALGNRGFHLLPQLDFQVRKNPKIYIHKDTHILRIFVALNYRLMKKGCNYE